PRNCRVYRRVGKFFIWRTHRRKKTENYIYSLAKYFCSFLYSFSFNADTEKLSDSSVPVLKVIFPEERSSMNTSTTVSHRSSSLVFTPVIFFILRSSTKAAISVAYETCCLIFLIVCSFFFFWINHMNPAARF
ncbi:hypothetical protein MUK42_33749, partial [Musa troglodytarum]